MSDLFQPHLDFESADAAEAGKPTPLSELPAAPPAPELSSPDEPGKADK